MKQPVLARAIKGAAYLATLCGPFLIQPPTTLFQTNGTKATLSLTEFLLAIIIGIWSLAIIAFRPKVKVWLLVAVVGFLGFTVSMSMYQQVRMSSITRIEGKDEIIGSACQDHVIHDYGGCPAASVLLPDFGYDPSQIWTSKSIQRNTTLLTVWYILMLASLATAVVSLTNGSVDLLDARRSDDDRSKTVEAPV